MVLLHHRHEHRGFLIGRYVWIIPFIKRLLNEAASILIVRWVGVRPPSQVPIGIIDLKIPPEALHRLSKQGKRCASDYDDEAEAVIPCERYDSRKGKCLSALDVPDNEASSLPEMCIGRGAAREN
jgi:hypothetical protein